MGLISLLQFRGGSPGRVTLRLQVKCGGIQAEGRQKGQKSPGAAMARRRHPCVAARGSAPLAARQSAHRGAQRIAGPFRMGARLGIQRMFPTVPGPQAGQAGDMREFPVNAVDRIVKRDRTVPRRVDHIFRGRLSDRNGVPDQEIVVKSVDLLPVPGLQRDVMNTGGSPGVSEFPRSREKKTRHDERPASACSSPCHARAPPLAASRLRSFNLGDRTQ